MNAIISAAAGYGRKHIRPFLETIAKHVPDTVVYLIVSHRSRRLMEGLIKDYPFVKPIFILHKHNKVQNIFKPLSSFLIKYSLPNINPALLSLGTYLLDISLDRYFCAWRIVDQLDNRIQHVMLSDCRDVVFQNDPFSFSRNLPISGLENQTIGACPYNRGWIHHLYGPEVLSEMADQVIICAGLTMGPVQTVKNYLLHMCAELWKHLPKVIGGPGFDQGIHNYLIFRKIIPFGLTENRDGIIATLGYETRENISIEEKHRKIKIHGVYPAVIHQYDRHSELVSV